MSLAHSARERYSERLKHFADIQNRLSGRNQRFIALRTVLFFAAAILLFAGYLGAEPRWLLLGSGWSLACAFLVAITAHEHLRLAELAAQRNGKLYLRLLARLDRKWESIDPLPSGVSERSPLADDLDLFGKASLWQLLCLPSTLFGRRTLGQWLLTVPDWPTVRLRQSAVKDLMGLPELRESILDRIATISDDCDNANSLADWAKGAAWLPEHRVAHWLSFVGPTLVGLGIATLLVAASQSESVITWMWIAVGLLGSGFAINLLLTLGWGSWLHDIFLRVTGSNRDAQQLTAIFELLGKLPTSSPMLAAISQQASLGPSSAVEGFRQLLWRVRLANLQRDPLFYVVYLILQLTMAWDFRVMESLQSWQLRFGAVSAQWFTALGECEALLAGATLADEYPDWCFPEENVSASTELFRGQAIGHPLLSDGQRVVNDVFLELEQPLLLVTGSNMAGKSTLLRALGLNQILARAGAPACARSYRTPLYDLATSIRVRDSLHEGVSFFMAELKRLKEVVDLAEKSVQQIGHPPVLFLLDEILQGTNSRERQIAVMKVVQRLLECNACGAISTHDLELADQGDVLRVSQIVHFREYFENDSGQERMRFDYLMRPGPTPTTNALKLLQLVGL